MQYSVFWTTFLELVRIQVLVLAVLLSPQCWPIPTVHSPFSMTPSHDATQGHHQWESPYEDKLNITHRISYNRGQLFAINSSIKP